MHKLRRFSEREKRKREREKKLQREQERREVLSFIKYLRQGLSPREASEKINRTIIYVWRRMCFFPELKDKYRGVMETNIKKAMMSLDEDLSFMKLSRALRLAYSTTRKYVINSLELMRLYNQKKH